jgi:hypothetical protein
MNHITIIKTSFKKLADPEPLPEITESPRQAFLAGWWGGICTGCVIGACGLVALLSAFGRWH